MTWFLTGFKKGNGSITHEIDLDQALRSLLQAPPAGQPTTPVMLEPVAVQRLAQLLDLRLDPDQASYALVASPDPAHSGTMLRESRAGTGVRNWMLDDELTRLFANVLGESLDYLQGDGFGAAFPLHESRFARITDLLGLDLSWGDADWFVEEMSRSQPG